MKYVAHTYLCKWEEPMKKSTSVHICVADSGTCMHRVQCSSEEEAKLIYEKLVKHLKGNDIES